jgi:hypothetical protein
MTLETGLSAVTAVLALSLALLSPQRRATSSASG